MSDHKQETNNGRDPKGLFLQGVSGNPNGRPKGSRNRLTEQFLSDLCAQWEISGQAALKKMAEEEVVDFVRVVASLVPHRVDASLAIVDADLLREQRTFMEYYKVCREFIGADTPLIEAEAKE
jgi:hypothetical protein